VEGNIISKRFYPQQFHLIKDKKINLAYDIENIKLIQLNNLETEILETIRSNPVSISELKNIFVNYKDQVESATREMMNLKLIDYSPFKGISKRETYNYEKNLFSVFMNKKIFHIALNITHKCNLNCYYCYGEDGSYGGPSIHMSKDIAEQSIRFLMKESGESEHCRITFFGGEPLLNFSLLKYIVKYAREEASKNNKKILFSLTTNGTLLDDSKINYLVKEKVDTTLSIDGPREIHNQNRPFKGKNKIGSYDIIYPNVVRFIKKANKNRCFYAIRSTITRPGINNIYELIDYFNRFKTDYVKFDFAEYKDGNMPRNMSIDEDDVKKFRQELKEASDEFIRSRLYGERPKYKALFIGPLKSIEKRIKKKSFCISPGITYATVSVNGDVFPCHRLVGFKETKIGDVWEGIDKSKWLNCYKKANIYHSQKCSQCWAKYFCGGMCPATNYFLGKKFILCKDMDPVHCKILKVLFDEALILYSSLANLSNDNSNLKDEY
jgi:uncharacterized protein